MYNAKLILFLASVSMAVCMELPFPHKDQKSVLYCSSSTCMRCTYSECTVGQNCTFRDDFLPDCPIEKWKHLPFSDETVSSQISMVGHQDPGYRARRDDLPSKEILSSSNYGVHLCDSMEGKSSPKCVVLMPQHHARITINGNTKIYKGSCYQNSVDYLVRVERNDLIEIDCQPDISEKFRASNVQLPCNIKCKLPINEAFICTINIKVEVGTSPSHHVQRETKISLSDATSSTLRPPLSTRFQLRGGGGNLPPPSCHRAPVFDVLIMILLVVLICLMVVVLRTIKEVKYRRHSRSIELDSETSQSNDPTITHTYGMTGYLGERTPFRDDKGQVNDNPLLRFTRGSLQSNNTFQGLTQSQAGSIPRTITPYAVTCICSGDNSLRHLNHLSKSPGVDVSTYLDLTQ